MYLTHCGRLQAAPEVIVALLTFSQARTETLAVAGPPNRLGIKGMTCCKSDLPVEAEVMMYGS